MVRLTTFHDNEDLLALTASNPMQRAISLRIDRKLDFFRILQVRGESITYLLEKDKKVVGSFSASKSHVYIQGKPATIYYLSDLKVASGYRAGLLHSAARVATPGTRCLFRNLIIPRKVPAALQLTIRKNETISTQLLRQDRSFVYGKVAGYTVSK